jgi:AMP-polyphosphate phosphotransferase
MFEAAEIGHRVAKEAFKARVPALRGALLDAQADLAEAKKKFEVVILVAGMAGAGKGDAVNTLLEWFDPRHVETHALREPTDEEGERPPMWRYWRALPAKGRIGIFFVGWYDHAVAPAVAGEIGRAEMDQRLDDIVRFERMLANEGALVLKFWLHLSRRGQKERLAKLEADEATAWKATREDWRELKNYKTIARAWGHAIRMTNIVGAPWHIVEATDRRYCQLAIGETIERAMRRRLDGPAAAPVTPVPAAVPPAPVDGKRLIDTLDLTLKATDEEYKERLGRLQGRLSKLTRRKRFKKRGAVIVFEGMDAAGKGGAIRRVVGGIDARFCKVVPIAAPTDEERAHPYLWRFWRHLPRNGHVTIFDRSWYGRVLVERVEGYAAEADWMRAYTEINDFEDAIAKDGTVLVKFWLATSSDEQLRRFKEREATGFKRYKIGPDDYRNRDKWDAYMLAANDMFERTSTGAAPWTLVEAEDKNFARLKVLDTICEAIERAL